MKQKTFYLHRGDLRWGPVGGGTSSALKVLHATHEDIIKGNGHLTTMKIRSEESEVSITINTPQAQIRMNDKTNNKITHSYKNRCVKINNDTRINEFK